MEKPRLEFADALRGYAILWVIAVHTWVVLNPENLPVWSKDIFYNGVYGVQLFFITSAFTLFYSLTYTHAAKEGWLAFFIRRIFRVIPMFYISIILYSVLITGNWFTIVGTSAGDSTWLNILSHFSFLFAVIPAYLNTLVAGGWTVAVELMFYATIPVLYTFVKTKIQALALLLTSIIIAFSFVLFANAGVLGDYIKQFDLYMILPSQFPVFCLGIVMFFLLKDMLFESASNIYLSKTRQKYIGITCLAGFFIMFFITLPYIDLFRGILAAYLISALFLVFAIGIALYPVKLFVNRYINHLGRISYSCYLLHFIVLSAIWLLAKPFVLEVTVPVLLAFYVLGVLITAVFSHFTYNYIEQPGITTGKQLIRKFLGDNNV